MNVIPVYEIIGILAALGSVAYVVYFLTFSTEEERLEDIILKRYPDMDKTDIMDCYSWYREQQKTVGQKPEKYVEWLRNWVEMGDGK